MNEITLEWVSKAENDYEAAELTLRGRETPIVDAVCFHSQQCAEKYLKAFLQEHETRFERRHELMPLLELCIGWDSEFEILRGALQKLEQFAVLIRYPGFDVPVDVAADAFQAAASVRTFLRKKLGL
ncbi:MAG: HEPN domain-containing protein [Chloroflexota bacterium]